MKTLSKKGLSAIIAVLLALSLTTPAIGADKATIDAALDSTAAYMLQTVRNPQVDSVGGEWAVIGLARSGYDVPDSYYENYYRTVERYVQEHGAILHDRKYTDNSRVILGLTAAGYDPRDVAGYDLTFALGDFERTIWQGINGPIFALIALDCFDYPIPANPDAETQATRDMYIAEILRRQTPDGGWNLAYQPEARRSGDATVGAYEIGDADLTGMAMQALAKYQDRPDVHDAIEAALVFLSGIQDDEGGYVSSFSGGSSAIESTVQVLVALCELGIPIDDPRFVKYGNTLVDNILSYGNPDGSFTHSRSSNGNDQMATEQALYALVAAQRAMEGKSSLYRMPDTVQRGESRPADTIGLPGKHANVNIVPVTIPGKTFADISGHTNRTAIEALAERGVITGKSDTSFDPDATMTRAEFAAIMTRGLGLDSGQATRGGSQEAMDASGHFSDVSSAEWYFNAVETAYYYEIINGVGGNMFNPGGMITRQEAAVMVARAARLTGLDTARSDAEIRDTLAAFGDYRTVDNWAQEAMAFCYSESILDDTEFDIQPGIDIRRCEVAEMLYRMLAKAELL